MVFTDTFYGPTAGTSTQYTGTILYYIQSHNFHRKLAHAHIWPSVCLFLFLIHHKDREQQPKVLKGQLNKVFSQFFSFSRPTQLITVIL